MTLRRAFITPAGGTPVPVRFNPTQYALDRGNHIAEIGVPGSASPILQFVRGNAASLTMDLFFDTYEQELDVRTYTDAVYALLELDRTSRVPPVCTFSWGSFTFRCLVERVGGKFTMFLADGTPVRATLSVTFKECRDDVATFRAASTQPSAPATTRAVRRGDTLSQIAASEYGDPAEWRVIAKANGIENPRELTPGQVFAIPDSRGQG